METRPLQIFVAVYREKSFTKAAEQLYTSQPTVSEHIQNLQSRLNCRLFDRLGRSILPTAEAEMLYPSAVLLFQPFAEDELILVATAASQMPAAITMEELYTLPFIVRERGSGTRKSIEALFGQQQYALDRFNVCATLGSSASVKEAVKVCNWTPLF